MADTQNSNTLYKFRKNNYFYGKLMTVRDFEAEQDYINGKRHLLNRLTTGSGIVCGLAFDGGEVYAEGDNINITFQTGGVAIDCLGREISVPELSEKEIFVYENEAKVNFTTTHAQAAPYYLSLHFSAQDIESINSAANASACDSECKTNRVLENFEVIATTTPPESSSITCPDLSAAQTGEEIMAAMKTWLKEQISTSCSGCEESGVFILALEQNSSITIDTGTTLQYLSLVPDNTLLYDLLNCHVSNLDNPHKVTAGQVNALSLDGGTVTGSVMINTTDWSALTASASTTHGVLGRLTNDLTTGASYRAAGVVGISEIDEKHGVYAKAPDVGNALYVEGNAFFTGFKNAYVVDIFKNASGKTLETGDVIKLKDSPISRFYGNDNKIPVPEITLANIENDECIIGIIDRRAISQENENTLSPEPKKEKPDPSVIPDGEELHAVTLGTYSRCKVDASTAPIKRGNLLTSSKNPGYAQKAIKPKIGRIIGKALEPLKESTGYIAIFVNIQ
jgi:hypothetical protein